MTLTVRCRKLILSRDIGLGGVGVQHDGVTMRDRAIWTKFLTRRVSLQSTHLDCPNIFCLTKNGGHFEFSNFFAKIAIHTNAYILKTVLDRIISVKFLTHRISAE